MDVVIKSFNGSKPTGTYFLEDLEPEPVKKNQSRFRPAPQHWLRKFCFSLLIFSLFWTRTKYKKNYPAYHWSQYLTLCNNKLRHACPENLTNYRTRIISVRYLPVAISSKKLSCLKSETNIVQSKVMTWWEKNCTSESTNLWQIRAVGSANTEQPRDLRMLRRLLPMPKLVAASSSESSSELASVEGSSTGTACTSPLNREERLWSYLNLPRSFFSPAFGF